MLKLYDYFRSSACFRVRIALHLKQLDYELIPIHLVNQGGEQLLESYQKINPACLVPALQDDDKILTQSMAIIEYINDLHPYPSLFPDTIFERALARSFALSITADIHPLNNLRILKYLTHELNVSEEKKTEWYKHWVDKGLAALEKQLLSHHRAGPFCFGDKPSIADICLVPQLYNARRFNCDQRLYPTLVQIDEHCQTHPAFIKAWPMETMAKKENI